MSHAAPVIQVNTDMNFLNSNTRMVVCDMQITPTTGTTVSSAKKVSGQHCPVSARLIAPFPVWVGPLVVKELKRIVESSEITK